MPQTIRIEPSAGGWMVKAGPFANAMFFHSGRCAEIAARDLAARMAQADAAVVIEIVLRDGSLGGRYLLSASAPDPMAHMTNSSRRLGRIYATE